MNRILTGVNLLGVLVLASLCVMQWKINSQLNNHADDLERTRQQQTAKIADQEKTIAGNTQDLDDFRKRLDEAQAQIKQMQTNLDGLSAQNKQLEAERAQFTATLEKWKEALAGRDTALKQASERIQQLGSERNTAVSKFNDLMTQYNSAGKELQSRQPNPK